MWGSFHLCHRYFAAARCEPVDEERCDGERVTAALPTQYRRRVCSGEAFYGMTRLLATRERRESCEVTVSNDSSRASKKNEEDS